MQRVRDQLRLALLGLEGLSLQSGSTRELALVRTKIQEADHWLRDFQEEAGASEEKNKE